MVPLELALADLGVVATGAVTAISAGDRQFSWGTRSSSLQLPAASASPSRGATPGYAFSVSDTGPGIPPEFHEKIFEKFGQVEAARHGAKHSSGLGLTFCKFAVEAHGGTIGVDSVVGQGSTFWFVVPQQGPAPTAAAPAPAGS